MNSWETTSILRKEKNDEEAYNYLKTTKEYEEFGEGIERMKNERGLSGMLDAIDGELSAQKKANEKEKEENDEYKTHAVSMDGWETTNVLRKQKNDEEAYNYLKTTKEYEEFGEGIERMKNERGLSGMLDAIDGELGAQKKEKQNEAYKPLMELDDDDFADEIESVTNKMDQISSRYSDLVDLVKSNTNPQKAKILDKKLRAVKTEKKQAIERIWGDNVKVGFNDEGDMLVQRKGESAWINLDDDSWYEDLWEGMKASPFESALGIVAGVGAAAAVTLALGASAPVIALGAIVAGISGAAGASAGAKIDMENNADDLGIRLTKEEKTDKVRDVFLGDLIASGAGEVAMAGVKQGSKLFLKTAPKVAVAKWKNRVNNYLLNRNFDQMEKSIDNAIRARGDMGENVTAGAVEEKKEAILQAWKKYYDDPSFEGAVEKRGNSILSADNLIKQDRAFRLLYSQGGKVNEIKSALKGNAFLAANLLKEINDRSVRIVNETGVITGAEWKDMLLATKKHMQDMYGEALNKADEAIGEIDIGDEIVEELTKYGEEIKDKYILGDISGAVSGNINAIEEALEGGGLQGLKKWNEVVKGLNVIIENSSTYPKKDALKGIRNTIVDKMEDVAKQKGKDAQDLLKAFNGIKKEYGAYKKFEKNILIDAVDNDEFAKTLSKKLNTNDLEIQNENFLSLLNRFNPNMAKGTKEKIIGRMIDPFVKKDDTLTVIDWRGLDGSLKEASKYVKDDVMKERLSALREMAMLFGNDHDMVKEFAKGTLKDPSQGIATTIKGRFDHMLAKRLTEFIFPFVPTFLDSDANVMAVRYHLKEGLDIVRVPKHLTPEAKKEFVKTQTIESLKIFGNLAKKARSMEDFIFKVLGSKDVSSKTKRAFLRKIPKEFFVQYVKHDVKTIRDFEDINSRAYEAIEEKIEDMRQKQGDE